MKRKKKVVSDHGGRERIKEKFTRFEFILSFTYVAEIARKWALKQIIDGFKKEMHGHRITPSGI